MNLVRDCRFTQGFLRWEITRRQGTGHAPFHTARGTITPLERIRYHMWNKPQSKFRERRWRRTA